MGGLNMESMRSKRGEKEHGDLEVAHPAPTSRPLSTTGARNLKGVKQPTRRQASVPLRFAWQRYRSTGPPIRWEMGVSARVS